MTKKDLEPAVKISRRCFACKTVFTLGHPKSPRLLCDKCQAVLGEMIMERRQELEQQEVRNEV